MEKVLLLVPSLALGGQEHIAINTADILEKDYHVVICVFTSANAVFKTHHDIIDIDLPSKNGVLNKIKNVIHRVRSIKKIKHELRIHLTISFGTSTNLVNLLSRCSDKVIVTCRGYGSLASSVVEKITGRLVYGKADKTVCVAEKLSLELVKRYSIPAQKVKTLYNPCDFTNIAEKAKENIPLQLNPPTIVSVGRLTQVKGYRHLMNALKLAMERIPDVQLMLVGDGDERALLEQYAINLGIFEHVIFTGFQSNPYSYEAKCDLYVLSSISEGFPNALVEAMACGLPVIATDCNTGPREILAKEFENTPTAIIEYTDWGILIPPFLSDDSDEFEKDTLLAKAMVELLTNEELRTYYGRRSQDRAKDFSFEAYREKITRIIEE